MAGSVTSAAQAVQVTMLPGWRRADGTHVTAVRMALAPGWKTYWRAPGDGGIPPSFSWRGSRNIGQVTKRWPRPFAFRINGMLSIGYKNELVLPLEITPETPGAPIHVRLKLDLGVCEDICVPVTVRLNTVLPAGGSRDPAILNALASQPDSAAGSGVGTVSCSVAPIADGLRVTSRIEVPPLGGARETVVFEMADPNIWVGEATTRREGNTLIAVSDLLSYAHDGIVFDRSRLRLTLLGDERAVDIQGCPAG